MCVQSWCVCNLLQSACDRVCCDGGEGSTVPELKCYLVGKPISPSPGPDATLLNGGWGEHLRGQPGVPQTNHGVCVCST